MFNEDFRKLIANEIGKRERLTLKLERCRLALDRMERNFELKYGVSPRECDKETLRAANSANKSDLAFWDFCSIESKIGEIRLLTEQIENLDARLAELRENQYSETREESDDNEDSDSFDMDR